MCDLYWRKAGPIAGVTVSTAAMAGGTGAAVASATTRSEFEMRAPDARPLS